MMYPRCWVHRKLIHMRLSFYIQVCLLNLIFFLSRFDIKFVDKRLLLLDLLSIHLIRNTNGSTIISYHPTLNMPGTTAPFLHERIRFAGAFKLIIKFSFTYRTPRAKRVLAKHVPKVARSYSRSFNIYMAYYVCMG